MNNLNNSSPSQPWAACAAWVARAPPPAAAPAPAPPANEHLQFDDPRVTFFLF